MLSADKVAALGRRSLLTAGSGVVAASLVGCGSDKPKNSSAQTDEVTFVTGFNITGQDAFVYAAIENGYYREVGLSVKVQPGRGTRENLLALKAGNAQFAVIDITGGLLEIDRGTPADFRVFAAIYQQTVSCIVSLSKAGINSPKDLAGKRIAYFEGGVNKTVFPAYAHLAGIDEATIKWQPVQPQAIRQVVVAGQVDAGVEIVVGRPALEALAKQRISMLPYSDVVRDLYGNGLGASADLIRSNPDLVRRFRDATLRGVAWAIENPDQAGAMVHKHVPEYKAEVAAGEIRESVNYIRGSARVIGQIDRPRVARNIAILQAVGTIKPDLNPDRVVAFDLVPQ
ncbi:ABC transporter substrate-binding protein [Virgisporangium ochraceum]|uniref:Nitrate ABC transporter substrate-binding protein n=1 Tax=Virgisporangium ochraceum TaxID=65505 RepID=A0A8J4EGW9_9ACTN|nr:ABC transporter substrate-binding protein [Virgisporangium ochraceum]GIJ74141.1 nitrate ABC transporter substrate-binding protein [Virgisporangium ochraceum]